MSTVTEIVKPKKTAKSSGAVSGNGKVRHLRSELFPVVLKINTKSWTFQQFYDFCQANEEWRFETDSEGNLIIMPPTTIETSRKNNRLNFYLTDWAIKDDTGEAFESNGMFTLPSGAKKSPDAFWISKKRYWNLSKKDREENFAPIAPDFVLELRSKSDSLKTLQAKMREYIENGVRLAWLIDPKERKVHIYRVGGEVEILENPEKISGENVLNNFELNMAEIW